MAGYDRRLFERAGNLIELVREAGRTEPELTDVYERARTLGDRTRVEVFSSWPDATLRPGLDIATATDIYARPVQYRRLHHLHRRAGLATRTSRTLVE